MNRTALLSLLSSLKHFFLLDRGDVVVQLMEGAREELGKGARDISKTRLQSLLEMGEWGHCHWVMQSGPTVCKRVSIQPLVSSTTLWFREQLQKHSSASRVLRCDATG